MFKDDMRLNVIHHPNPLVGKTCIATQDIKMNERFYYWGIHAQNDTNNDYSLTTSDNKYIIDPTPYKNVMKLQFSNSPGPKEIGNIQPVNQIHKFKNLICQEFRATRNIKKHTQIVWNYGGSGWFKDRNLKAINISFENCPAPKRQKKKS